MSSRSAHQRLRHLCNAWAHHPAWKDPDAGALSPLDMLTEIEEAIALRKAELVDQARAEGASWTQIGNAIGRTKQAAQLRYGAKKPRATDDPQQTTIDEAIGTNS